MLTRQRAGSNPVNGLFSVLSSLEADLFAGKKEAQSDAATVKEKAPLFDIVRRVINSNRNE